MVIPCPSCQQKNRVAARDLGGQARCGKCKTDLLPLAAPIETDPELFDELTKDATLPVLVDFWAPWCGPCRMVAPEVHRVAVEMAGRALVIKLNTEEHPEIGARFGVTAIPNFLVMKQGRVLLQRPGAVAGEQMKRWLEEAAAA